MFQERDNQEEAMSNSGTNSVLVGENCNTPAQSQVQKAQQKEILSNPNPISYKKRSLSAAEPQHPTHSEALRNPRPAANLLPSRAAADEPPRKRRRRSPPTKPEPPIQGVEPSPSRLRLVQPSPIRSVRSGAGPSLLDVLELDLQSPRTKMRTRL